MSILLELAMSAGTGLSFLLGGGKISSYLKKKKVPKINTDGSLNWEGILYKTDKENGYGSRVGLRCPKCTEGFYRDQCIDLKKGICSCPEYHMDHYHYRCVRCKYKAILQPADQENA